MSRGCGDGLSGFAALKVDLISPHTPSRADRLGGARGASPIHHRALVQGALRDSTRSTRAGRETGGCDAWRAMGSASLDSSPPSRFLVGRPRHRSTRVISPLPQRSGGDYAERSTAPYVMERMGGDRADSSNAEPRFGTLGEMRRVDIRDLATSGLQPPGCGRRSFPSGFAPQAAPARTRRC